MLFLKKQDEQRSLQNRNDEEPQFGKWNDLQIALRFANNLRTDDERREFFAAYFSVYGGYPEDSQADESSQTQDTEVDMDEEDAQEDAQEEEIVIQQPERREKVDAMEEEELMLWKVFREWIASHASADYAFLRELVSKLSEFPFTAQTRERFLSVTSGFIAGGFLRDIESQTDENENNDDDDHTSLVESEEDSAPRRLELYEEQQEQQQEHGKYVTNRSYDYAESVPSSEDTTDRDQQVEMDGFAADMMREEEERRRQFMASKPGAVGLNQRLEMAYSTYLNELRSQFAQEEEVRKAKAMEDANVLVGRNNHPGFSHENGEEEDEDDEDGQEGLQQQEDELDDAALEEAFERVSRESIAMRRRAEDEEASNESDFDHIFFAEDIRP
jgi:hypothetical protein